ncbi:alpha/beta fold hydrolase [Pseudoruegeria sp. HB172150]|uniref:alpha/beta fold hydrolase n=1 Tax=Pseudoruegeria sp. HB172150 TaxID=2721164 RepID=UPI0015519787|nr:alpha/beta hydrolase [Pseudoruegeria sp. HB172150]
MATLVYVPGLLSDARVWKPVAEAVGGDYRIADVTEPPSITAMAEHALGLAVGDVIPVGHSMGGRVAMEMARIAPERMAGLILADTGHHPLGNTEPEKRLEKVALGYDDMAALAADWLPPMVDADRRGDTAFMDDMTEMVVACGPEVHERQIRALMNRPDAGAHLDAVTCPVLLLVGTGDLWSPEKQHREIAEMVGAEAKVVVIPDAGHFLPCERPAEVATAISAWLKATSLT